MQWKVKRGKYTFNVMMAVCTYSIHTVNSLLNLILRFFLCRTPTFTWSSNIFLLRFLKSHCLTNVVKTSATSYNVHYDFRALAKVFCMRFGAFFSVMLLSINHRKSTHVSFVQTLENGNTSISKVVFLPPLILTKIRLYSMFLKHVSHNHSFHYHLTVLRLNNLKRLKWCKINLSVVERHFTLFWQSFNVSIKCRAAASWELFMPFSPFVSWLFLPHIIKLTSVEVFFGEGMTLVLSLRGDGSISKCLVQARGDERNVLDWWL